MKNYVTSGIARRTGGIAGEERLVHYLEGVENPLPESGLKELNDCCNIHTEETSLRNPALPIVDGLNPSRVRVDEPGRALDIVHGLIRSQHHHDPADDEAAVLSRFDAGNVRLDDGTVLRPDSTVSAGAFIWFYRRPAPERPVPGELRELYRDERLLVVDKPPFMSTLPRGQHITETAVVRARRQFGIDALSPAHRLDRLTRGVLLFTTRQDARGRYQRLFETRQVHKIYEAVTGLPEGWEDIADATGLGDNAVLPVPRGALSADSAACSLPRPTANRPWTLQHHMVKLRGRMATYLTKDAPNASTKVTGVRIFGDAGRRKVAWRLEPHSGRTHQLRVNMRLFGAPILGDPLYSRIADDALWIPEHPMPFVPAVADEDFAVPMQLTAAVVCFVDPFTGMDRSFTTTYTTAAI